jgi:hypothetical protein
VGGELDDSRSNSIISALQQYHAADISFSETPTISEKLGNSQTLTWVYR